MQVDCGAGLYSYGVYSNGTLKCRTDSGTSYTASAGVQLVGADFSFNTTWGDNQYTNDTNTDTQNTTAEIFNAVDNGTFYLLSNPYNFYNASDFSIADYVLSSVLFGYGYYNSTDFNIADYSTKAAADLLYAPIAITGTVTNIATGNGLTGGAITSTGTISTDATTANATQYSYWSGSAWLVRNDENDDTTYSAGNGISEASEIFSVAGGDGLTQEANGLKVTADGITDTQLEYNTGQALTTTSDVTFQNVTTGNLNSIDCITFDSGGKICTAN